MEVVIYTFFLVLSGVIGSVGVLNIVRKNDKEFKSRVEPFLFWLLVGSVIAIGCLLSTRTI